MSESNVVHISAGRRWRYRSVGQDNRPPAFFPTPDPVVELFGNGEFRGNCEFDWEAQRHNPIPEVNPSLWQRFKELFV